MGVAVRRRRPYPASTTHPEDKEAVQALQAEGVQAGKPQRSARYGDKEHGQYALKIQYADVTAVPGVTQKASPSTKAEFDEMINGTGVDEAELQREREKTNRHLRLAEMLRQYSKEAEMIVMTLPLPRKGQSPALYAA